MSALVERCRDAIECLRMLADWLSGTPAELCE